MCLPRAAVSLNSLPGLSACSTSTRLSPQPWGGAFTTTPLSDEKAWRAGHVFSRDMSATSPVDNSCPKVMGAL